MGSEKKIDYPEHLNPFKKAPSFKRSFRNSFRDIVGTVVRPFQKPKSSIDRQTTGGDNIKKPEPVQLRNTNSYQPPRSHTLLPRSRFAERVEQAKTFNGSVRSLNSTNPFDDEDAVDSTTINSVTPSRTEINTKSSTKRYRRKKRAPLPPNMRRGESLSVPDHHNSAWSVSSYETDCSTYTNNSTDHELAELTEGLKDIQEMSAEIVKHYTKSEQNEFEAKTEPDNPFENVINSNVEFSSDVESLQVNVCDIKINDNALSDNKCESDKINTTDDETEIAIEEKNTDNNYERKVIEELETNETNQEIVTIDKQIDNVEANIEDHVNGNEATVLETSTSFEELNNNCPVSKVLQSDAGDTSYIENKTIFIATTKEERIYSERKSIYITGSRDELDTVSVEEMHVSSEPENNDGSCPVPKIRKHKLTKEKLLGSESSQNFE